MTYPPGGPGYPTTQQPAQQYGAPTQQFERPPDSGSSPPLGSGKLPVYLGAAVAALGLAAYLAGFGPLYKGVSGSAAVSIGAAGSTLLLWPLLAGLLAGVGLLPKQDLRSGVVAALAVLGVLQIISTAIGGSSVGWAFYLLLVFSILQAGAAVWNLLLDAGVVTAPAPRPRADAAPYGAYGQPPQYYGQPSYGGPTGPSQQPSYQQYGGYQGGASSTGGFPSLNRPGGPPNGPQNGPPTPPTGFPAFGQPPAQSSGDLQTNVTAQPSQQSAPPPS